VFPGKAGFLSANALLPESVVKTPLEYLKKLDKFQMVDVGGKITQDVLVIGARRDHCNCGNSKLCFDTMMSWIDQIKARGDSEP
jgi:hypothetical protein